MQCQWQVSTFLSHLFSLVRFLIVIPWNDSVCYQNTHIDVNSNFLIPNILPCIRRFFSHKYDSVVYFGPHISQVISTRDDARITTSFAVGATLFASLIGRSIFGNGLWRLIHLQIMCSTEHDGTVDIGPDCRYHIIRLSLKSSLTTGKCLTVKFNLTFFPC